jgi:hypothetical protein
MKKSLYFAGLTCFSFILTGCQLFQNTADNHHAMCKELKNQIIFNGQNANPSIAFQERADKAKLNESYHDEGCN